MTATSPSSANCWIPSRTPAPAQVLSSHGPSTATGTAHARDIVTDTGWKIVLDRGLDIFQAPIRKDGFSLGDRLQEHRMIKGFYVTYVRNGEGQSV